MPAPSDMTTAETIAADLLRELELASPQDTPHLRRIRRRYSGRLSHEPPKVVFRVVSILVRTRYRWIAYELSRLHPASFQRVTPALLQRLGRGIDSWWTTDAFARTLSGPLWLRRQAPDRLFVRWAGSPSPWWRRAALVSTVALNLKSDGGKGDTRRTLSITSRLATDHHPMVAKALSWAMRALVPHDRPSVARFLAQHDAELDPLVKREVQSKLRTGLKNPRRKRQG